MSQELVEKVARAMCTARGADPDEIHTIGLGEHRQSLPYWKMQVEWAVRTLAAIQVLKDEGYLQ